MAHLRVQQMQAVFQAHALDAGVGGGVEFGALAAVGHVDGIHILHQVDGLLLADMLIERAAKLVGDVVLAVGKRARAAEAAHDAAGLALDTGLDLLAVDGAAALLQRLAQLQHRDLQRPFGIGKLPGGKDPAGAGADDDNVVIHGNTPFHAKKETPHSRKKGKGGKFPKIYPQSSYHGRRGMSSERSVKEKRPRICRGRNRPSVQLTASGTYTRP